MRRGRWTCKGLIVGEDQREPALLTLATLGGQRASKIHPTLH